MKNLIDRFLISLQDEIRLLPLNEPEAIFNGAKYSFSNSQNPFTKRSHSLMTSLIVKVLWKILDDGKYLVEIEPRIHYRYEEEKAYFNPDVAVYEISNSEKNNIEDTKPVLFIDYESPNSSDARVGRKDIDPYIYFCEEISNSHEGPSYLILTSHRDGPIEKDDLSRVLSYGYNQDYKDKAKDKVLENALDFWAKVYQDFIDDWINDNWNQVNNVVIANISSGKINVTHGGNINKID